MNPYNYGSGGHPCPRFEKCGASWCPLLAGKPDTEGGICLWMLESVKEGGLERIASLVHREEVLNACVDAAKDVISGALASPAGYRQTLERAAQSPSRIESGRRLRSAA